MASLLYSVDGVGKQGRKVSVGKVGSRPYNEQIGEYPAVFGRAHSGKCYIWQYNTQDGQPRHTLRAYS